MYCYFCGKEIIEEAEYCRYCGKRQHSDGNSVVTDSSEVTQTAAHDDFNAEDQPELPALPVNNQPAFKKKRITIIVCIIVLTVLLLLVSILVPRMIRSSQIRNDVERAGDHHYFITGGAVGTYWQQSTLESELALCNYNKKKPSDSTIMFGTYSRTFTWEINNDLEFIITYTSGKDERVVYTYSEKDKENKNTWYFDKETEALYLGYRIFHPVGVEDLRFK